MPGAAAPPPGVVAVTGYDEASEVYRDDETFSSCNSVIGPFATFPVPLEGDDVGDIIDRYRDQLPMNEHMVTMDPPDHTRERALLMRLITPQRLKENEAFMWRLADEQLDEFLADGQCEFISAYTQPFAMLVVADLLGVPEEDHQRFREGFGLSHAPGEVGAGDEAARARTRWPGSTTGSAEYIEDRRRQPRKDVLTDLALATYPDGTTPEVTAVVRTATFLFAAGQETTARLLAAALKYLAEHPELQDELRADSDRIPDFIEEVLRIESPVKADFRLARRSTTDRRGRRSRPARRSCCSTAPPTATRGSSSARPSSAPTGPTPRRTWPSGGASTPARAVRWPAPRDGSASSASSTAPGTSGSPRSTTGRPGARRFDYEPTWVLRGLTDLHLEFTPVGGAAR